MLTADQVLDLTACLPGCTRRVSDPASNLCARHLAAVPAVIRLRLRDAWTEVCAVEICGAMVHRLLCGARMDARLALRQRCGHPWLQYRQVTPSASVCLGCLDEPVPA